MNTTTTAFRKILDAAASGDPAAKRALAALEVAADAVADDIGSRKGIDEARRRFGPPPDTAA